MKIKNLLTILAILALLGLAACQAAQPGGEAATVAPAATTEVQAGEASPSAPPTQEPSPSAPPPTEVPTQAPPAPTETPAATPSAAPASISPTSAAATLPAAAGELPVSGEWSGSGDGLLLTFTIVHENGQALMSDLLVFWSGPGVCVVDILAPTPTAIDPQKFTRTYETDEMHYRLEGHMQAPDLLSGEIKVHHEECSERSLKWIASPKASAAASGQSAQAQPPLSGAWHGSGPMNASIDFEIIPRTDGLLVLPFHVEWQAACQGKDTLISLTYGEGANIRSGNFGFDYEHTTQGVTTTYQVDAQTTGPDTVEGIVQYADPLCGPMSIAWLATPLAGVTPGP
jgi:hypothetical protein